MAIESGQSSTQRNSVTNFTTAGSNYFKRFDTSNDISITQNTVTEPLFNGVNSLTFTSFFTESGINPSSSFISVYQSNSISSLKLFDLGYGVQSGSEAGNYTNEQVSMYAGTKAMLGDTTNNLFFSDLSIGVSGSNRIAVVAIPKNNFKDRLDEGNWELRMYDGVATRSYVDNSVIASGTFTRVGLRTIIKSGTLVNGIASVAASSENYGYAYHDLGLLVFDARYKSAFSTISLTPAAVTQSFKSMSYVYGRASTFLKSANYFCRLLNKEFNYSTNPSYINYTNGNIQISDFLGGTSRTYVTTIGLYNDNNELLAVAKASVPVQKSWDKESIFRVRLDF